MPPHLAMAGNRAGSIAKRCQGIARWATATSSQPCLLGTT